MNKTWIIAEAESCLCDCEYCKQCEDDDND